jgi:putative MATE family efflux protein
MDIKDTSREQILHGSLLKVIFVLLIPVLGSHFLETAWHFLNGFWIGRLGPVSFAAVNVSSFLIWMFYAFVGIMNTGTSSLVAQMEGAGEREKAQEIAHQGIMGVAFLSIAYSLAMILFGKRIFAAMGASPQVVAEAYRYTFLIFLFGLPFGLMEVISAILRGYGDTKTPFTALSFGFLVTFIFDPLLILGIGPFPRLGIAGGGIAANIGFSLTLAIFLVRIFRRRLKFTFDPRYLHLKRSLLVQIIQIGLPPSLSSLTFSVVYILLTKIISTFGTEAMAAVGIGHRIESFSFMIILGFSMTAVTVIGQNLGAGNQARAMRASWILLGLITSVTSIISILYFTYCRPLVSIFIMDPATQEIASSYMRIVACCQIFMGLGIVLDGVFSGSGNTLPPMLINIPVTLLRVPLAYHLAIKCSMGSDGVWWAITILVVVRGLLSFLWFLLGRWKDPRYKRLLA